MSKETVIANPILQIGGNTVHGTAIITIQHPDVGTIRIVLMRDELDWMIAGLTQAKKTLTENVA